MIQSSSPTSEPEWLIELRRRTDQPPLHDREPLRVGTAHGRDAAGAIDVGGEPDANDPVAAPIGSMEPELARRMQAAGLPLRPGQGGWELEPPLDAALQRSARWLQHEGLGGRWRDELLAVVDQHGQRRGVVERAAVRALGIATHAVHLVGRAPGGAVWVQQRARDKAVDPGLWDTLMGGLVTADESSATTLTRETVEEAGLDTAALRDLVPAGRLTIRRPVADGYMVEHIEVYEAVVPAHLQPVNRDGEVERFECLAPDALIERLRTGAFTLEAGLILALSLQRRGLLRC